VLQVFKRTGTEAAATSPWERIKVLTTCFFKVLEPILEDTWE